MAINETNPQLALVDPGHRWRFDWVLPALFRPRQIFARITAANNGIWLTPIAILVLTTLGRVLAAGYLRQAAAATGQIPLPPNFEYFTPEQQAQFQQAMTATSGPVFIYVLPAILAVLGLLGGWLVVGWLLHLVLTLLGGRGSSSQALNVVAWALLPFAVRDLVRIVAMLTTNQPIAFPGLSGFAPIDGSNTSIYLVALLALVDIYFFWHILLLGIGVRAGNGLTTVKAWGAVVATALVLLLIRALPALIAAQFEGLTVVRPFF